MHDLLDRLRDIPNLLRTITETGPGAIRKGAEVLGEIKDTMENVADWLDNFNPHDVPDGSLAGKQVVAPEGETRETGEGEQARPPLGKTDVLRELTRVRDECRGFRRGAAAGEPAGAPSSAVGGVTIRQTLSALCEQCVDACIKKVQSAR